MYVRSECLALVGNKGWTNWRLLFVFHFDSTLSSFQYILILAILFFIWSIFCVAVSGYKIEDVLPGSEYTFSVFDGSASSIPVWTSSQDSEPEVPYNLSVQQSDSDKAATILYDPPANGGHTGFR